MGRPETAASESSKRIFPMFVRMKTGRYAGEVREFPFATARDLIANERATRYEFGSEVLRRVPAEAPISEPFIPGNPGMNAEQEKQYVAGYPKKKKAKGLKNGRT
jgi:hypothetical protein